MNYVEMIRYALYISIFVIFCLYLWWTYLFATGKMNNKPKEGLVGENDKCINLDTNEKMTVDDVISDVNTIITRKGHLAKKLLTPSGKDLVTGGAKEVDFILVDLDKTRTQRTYTKNQICAKEFAHKLKLAFENVSEKKEPQPWFS